MHWLGRAGGIKFTGAKHLVQRVHDLLVGEMARVCARLLDLFSVFIGNANDMLGRPARLLGPGGIRALTCGQELVQPEGGAADHHVTDSDLNQVRPWPE